MSGNRVEELEAKVRELEATVDGLTDELVETKERLQVLEEASDVETDVLSRGTNNNNAASTTTEQDAKATDGEASADEVNTDEDDGEDNADSESGDDIIVA